MQSAVTLYPGDNRDSLKKLIDQGVRVHACITDPPYGLVSIEKRFGKQGSAAARTEGNDGSFARLSKGFINRTWDGTGIERDPEFWKLIHDILLPGGFCFAFSSPRTGHWQACAMEMAGFIMHPFHVWAYSTGFPKAKDVEKDLTKAGADQLLIDEWAGWKYGTQSQKPAVEPIYLAQRPISEKTYIANIMKHGVGAVNIDDCRVPLDSVADARQLRTMNRNRREKDTSGQSWGLSKNNASTAQVIDEKGRYPANLFHDGSSEVIDLFLNCSGEIEAEKTADKQQTEVDLTTQPERDYSNSPARFFNAFPTDDCLAVLYHPKANKRDRGGSDHPTVKPVGLLRHLIRHITPPGGVVLDPFAGTGTTAVAARAEGIDCIIMESEVEYIGFLEERFGKSLTDQGTGVDAKSTDLSDLFQSDVTNHLIV